MSGALTESGCFTPIKNDLASQDITNFSNSYYGFSPSVTNSPGSTAKDLSLPATPKSYSFTPTPGLTSRRRSTTISSFPDHSLLNHPIFTLSKSDSDTKEVCDIILDDHQSQNMYVNRGTPNANECSTLSKTEYLSKGTNSDCEKNVSKKPDLRDLARNGLPSACVFVANLASSQTDDQLVESLQAHFSQFGRVHVKIRRDNKGNPYSFCQFENDESADNAVRDGRHAVIDPSGRRIRCEPAKVNRTLALMRHDSSVVTETDVLRELLNFGPAEAIEFAPDNSSSPMRGLREGRRCYVRFMYRQHAIDCFQYFRSHQSWSAEWKTNIQSIISTQSSQKIDIDPYSIFIGKLDSETTEDDLRKIFNPYGEIVDCDIYKKAGRNGTPRSAFAFIKFQNPEYAKAAVIGENNSQLMGHTIHVQIRESHKKALNHISRTRIFNQQRNKWNSPQWNDGSQLSAPTSYSFSIRDVADLAARLSFQIANQRDQRNPSMVSVVSDATAYPGMMLPAESMAARTAGFQNPVADCRFNHPFQNTRGNFNHFPTLPERPISPRTIQNTNGPSDAIHVARHDIGVSSTNGLVSLGTSAQNCYGNQSNFIGNPYFGSIPPLQHIHNVSSLMPRFFIADRRGSDLQIAYGLPVPFVPNINAPQNPY